MAREIDGRDELPVPTPDTPTPRAGSELDEDTPFTLPADAVAAPDASTERKAQWNDDHGEDPQPAVSAADAAWAAQGDLVAYPVRDGWENTTAEAGSRIWFGAALKPNGSINMDSIRGFGVLEGDGYNPTQVGDGFDPEGAAVGYDAQQYYEGVQGAPRDGEYRTHLVCYEFTTDVPIATGIAEGNTQWGEGGITQAFVPDVRALIEQHQLECLGMREMDNTSASSRVTYLDAGRTVANELREEA